MGGAWVCVLLVVSAHATHVVKKTSHSVDHTSGLIDDLVKELDRKVGSATVVKSHKPIMDLGQELDDDIAESRMGNNNNAFDKSSASSSSSVTSLNAFSDTSYDENSVLLNSAKPGSGTNWFNENALSYTSRVSSVAPSSVAPFGTSSALGSAFDPTSISSQGDAGGSLGAVARTPVGASTNVAGVTSMSTAGLLGVFGGLYLGNHVYSRHLLTRGLQGLGLDKDEIYGKTNTQLKAMIPKDTAKPFVTKPGCDPDAPIDPATKDPRTYEGGFLSELMSSKVGTQMTKLERMKLLSKKCGLHAAIPTWDPVHVAENSVNQVFWTHKIVDTFYHFLKSIPFDGPRELAIWSLQSIPSDGTLGILPAAFSMIAPERWANADHSRRERGFLIDVASGDETLEFLGEPLPVEDLIGVYLMLFMWKDTEFDHIENDESELLTRLCTDHDLVLYRLLNSHDYFEVGKQCQGFDSEHAQHDIEKHTNQLLNQHKTAVMDGEVQMECPIDMKTLTKDVRRYCGMVRGGNRRSPLQLQCALPSCVYLGCSVAAGLDGALQMIHMSDLALPDDEREEVLSHKLRDCALAIELTSLAEKDQLALAEVTNLRRVMMSFVSHYQGALPGSDMTPVLPETVEEWFEDNEADHEAKIQEMAEFMFGGGVQTHLEVIDRMNAEITDWASVLQDHCPRFKR